jgi:hypothetical protein
MLRFLLQELMDEESMDEQCMMNPQDSEGEIDTTIKPSQGDKVIHYHLKIHIRLPP